MFWVGLSVVFFLALAAQGIEAIEPDPRPVDAVILGILFGMALRQWVPRYQEMRSGLDFSSKRLLPLAIVLLGARLDFGVLLDVSGSALAINLVCVPFAFLVTLAIARWARLEENYAILVAIGTAICGGSAIVAAAPVIRAKESETAASVTAITLFGVLAIFCFPLLGRSLEMSQTQFGVWAGTAIQAVPQVLAAGFAYGEEAGELSLLVKLVRILFLAPFIFGLSLWRGSNGFKGGWQTYVPPFLLGFLAMVVLSSLGWISSDVKQLCSRVSSFLIVMTMVSVGSGTEVKGFFRSQAKVLGVAFASALILGATSYLLIVMSLI